MVLTEAELGYLAGLVDSEGCINIKCTRKRYYTLQIVVAQGNEHLLTYWQKRTGLGHIYAMKKEKTGNKNQSWQWYLNQEDATTLLYLILPYLILKKEEAKVALEFRKTLRTQAETTQYIQPNTPMNENRLTEDILKTRQAYKDTLHQLKHQRKGKANVI